MDDDLERLIPALRTYLLHPGACAPGLRALLEHNGMRLITEDEGEFLDWAEVRDFMEMPTAGGIQ